MPDKSVTYSLDDIVQWAVSATNDLLSCYGYNPYQLELIKKNKFSIYIDKFTTSHGNNK